MIPAEEADYLSAADMRQWSEREIKAISKAKEIRIREIESLVKAYEQGQINAEKADELKARYHYRWPDPLGGQTAADSVTDEQILASLDQIAEANDGPFRTPTELHQAAAERARRIKKITPTKREGR